MKKIFRKAMTIAGSAALIGMTVGVAAAASYPDPFTSNTAIVTGANAAPMDNLAAVNIAANLNAAAVGSTVTTLSGGDSVTENELVLGSDIIDGKVIASFTDTKLPSLLDEKITWDNGTSSEDYNIHEEVMITANKMMLKTSFDDNDLDGVEVSNDEGFIYHYVFDDVFPLTRSTTLADDLYLTILGQSYEVTAMTANSITINTAEETSVRYGETVTVDGESFTVEDLSSTAVKVNGEVLTVGGSSKKINGLRVEASDVFYNENTPEDNSVTLKIGEDLSKQYSDGEEFIGEPDVDYMWEWDIANLGSALGYVGVKYSLKETREKDDMIGTGDSYILPNDYAAITLDGLSDVEYSDIKISFEENVDLYNTTDGSDATAEDAEVMVIEAVSGEKDAFKLDADTETSKIYVRWATNETSGDAMYSQGSGATGRLEVLYEDVNNVVGESVRPRFYGNGTTSLALGNFTYGDTEVAITGAVSGNRLTVSMVGTDAAQDTHTTAFTVGGPALADTTGSLEWLGTATTTTEGNAEVTDVSVGTVDIGTKDNDIMTYDGFILRTPEANAEDDIVVLSVPSDKVYAQVSVTAGGEAATSGDAGVMTVTDANVASVAGKNLIVVGGSAINTVAAELLGAAYSEGAFTSATGVAAGEFMIESFDRAGQTALLVAGYNAADTEKAATYLLNNAVDTTVGTKLKGTSATEATLVTA